MKRTRYLILLLLACMLFLISCKKQDGNTQVVFTTGFAKDEIFRMETAVCRVPEIMVYLTNIQNQYESVYGEAIWDTKLDGVTLEENVKDTALARIAQVKAMNLLAGSYQVELTEEETEKAKKAAIEYFESLNEQEKEVMELTEDIVFQLYKELSLANKVYDYIIKDINPEISDDEARTITVEHILIKTYSLDGKGEKIPYSEEKKQEAYKKAKEICQKAKNNENFDQLLSTYNEDSKGTYSFRKGEMNNAFETAAFNLGKDEISDVVETEYGYHIIKCLSTFNREETDANKVKIVEQRKKEVFGQEYNEFVNGLRKNLNKDLWAQIHFIHDPQVKTNSFFAVYDTYFDKN